MDYTLDHADLQDHVRRQLAYIESSARAYDQGFEDEAPRLAVVIRVLLHDGRWPSLLTQLGVKNRLLYTDTAEPINPRNLVPTAGLVIMELGGGTGGRYIPPLDDLSPPRLAQPPKPFHRWWEAPVTKVAEGNVFSRKDYILTAADKEGGAHVDPKLDARYAQLTRDNALGWLYGSDDEPEKPLQGNPAYASVRQIAHEVEKTLRQHPLKLGLAA